MTSKTEEFWKNQHYQIASNLSSWVSSAERLLQAFTLLADQEKKDKQQKLSAPAMMLGGLAIENLLKAIHVSQGKKKLFRKDGEIHTDFKTHDCLKLAIDAGVSLDDKERKLMECLKQFIEYGGCYPVPIYYGNMRPRKFRYGGFGPPTSIANPSDFEAILNFAQKLKGTLSIVCNPQDGDD